MTNVFISYASEDRERARKLASALEACGWSVWWDRKIKAGQTFDQVIEHELETAKSVVVLWSKDSILSEWVKNEAAAAADRGVLVPALIDNIKLPLEFRRRQAADLMGWDGDPSHAGFQALCDGIARTAGIPAAAALGDSTTQRKASSSWNQRWIVSSIAAIAVVLALGAYIGLRLFLPQEIERSQGNSTSAPLEPEKRSEESKASSSSSKAKATADRQSFTKPGVFEFKWPGGDCWEIYRGEEKVTSSCGSGKQALQAGTYVVKPSSSAVFEPFKVQVAKGQTATVP
jgi:hypothetical protein